MTGNSFVKTSYLAFILFGASLVFYQNCSQKPLILGQEEQQAVATEVPLKIVGDYNHACMLANSAVKCWGGNRFGQLGNGTTTDQLNPVSVVGLESAVTDVAAGNSFSCAVKNGGAYCWGYNYYGTLGNGVATAPSETATTSPQQVLDLESGVTKISAGYNSACAIKAGALYCWGWNSNGQLGTGDFVQSPRPKAVVNMQSNVSAVAMTDYQGIHTCAIKAGALYCWGQNNNYQLGDGTTTNRNEPVAVVGLESGVTAVSVGFGYTCAIKELQLYCWGVGSSGRLGQGDMNPRTAPSLVSAFSGKIVQKISLSAMHACALVNNESYCWGDNQYGNIGNGQVNTASPTTPYKLFGLQDVVDIIAVGTHDGNQAQLFTFAITSTRKVYSWGGNNFGQLGTGNTILRSAPAESFSF